MDSTSSARMGTLSQDNVLDIADSQKIKGILKYISLL